MIATRSSGAYLSYRQEQQQIRLRDGRRFAYTDAGPEHGTPVVLIHGNPGSRLMQHPDEGIIDRLGVRLIVPDRPGFGYSTYQVNRKLTDLPDDIIQLMNRLGVTRFSVFGVSAGGPYVAALAHKYPERVRSAAMVSGVAPFDRADAYAGVNDNYRAAYQLGKLPAWMLFPAMAWSNYALLANNVLKWKYMVDNASPADLDVLGNPKIRAQINAFRKEATRFGSQGVVQETKIITRPWGFRLTDVRTPIHLWYWADDQIVSQQMGRFLHERLPNSIPHFEDGGGHFSIYTAWERILRGLLA